MGMANCLTSIKNGVKYIDATLQGIGRSSGNVVLEHLCCALKFNGLANQIDPIDIMDIGEKYIRPLLKSVGISSLDITQVMGTNVLIQIQNTLGSLIKEK